VAAPRIASVVLDCAEPRPLARFWAALTGGEVVFEGDEHCIVRTEHLHVAAVRVPGHRPPSWPDGPVPKQLHLDLAVTDLPAAVAEAVRLGAREDPHQAEPGLWRVLRDPAGHPFCLSTQLPD
jgi:hypothetical protein